MKIGYIYPVNRGYSMKRKLQLILIFSLSLWLTACNQAEENNTEQAREETPKVVKKRHEDGTLSSLNPVDEEGYVHGVKVNFYEDGVTVHSKVTYEHGRKHGPAIWFFKSGKIYEYSNYYQNRKNGVTRRYYETGELYEEITYDAGIEQPGKKRYSKEGELIE